MKGANDRELRKEPDSIEDEYYCLETLAQRGNRSDTLFQLEVTQDVQPRDCSLTRRP